MPLPSILQDTLSVPLVAAPMFLASGPDLVIATCKSGVVGSFPALNQRSSEGFEQWLNTIQAALAEAKATQTTPVAPYAVNLIVHRSNPRLQADLDLCVKHKVPMVITSLGAVPELVEAVHSYGGIVFHDVTTVRHAKKAAAAGVDGLIAVCAGAGGHAGTLSPFALVAEIRRFFDKTLLLAGCIQHGREIAAARLLGADLAYAGTRFINTEEAMVADDYKAMICDASAADIVYTPEISGVPGSFLRQSIINVGLDPNNLPKKDSIDFGEELQIKEDSPKAWKTVWSAGQGVGGIDDVIPAAQLCQRFRDEYEGALAALR